MADDQWWNSSTGSGGVSACSTAPATDTPAAGWMASASAAAAAESTSSIRFQDSHGHTTAASQQPLSDASTTFLVDPHMDWSQDFLGGKADVASLHAAVLRDDMSHGGFPLDQASHGVSIYGGGQSTAGYEDIPMVPFSQLLQPSVQQQQGGGAAQLQFSGSYEPPGFSSASGLFGSPSQLLLKALEPKPSCSSSSTLMVKSNSGSAQDSPAATKKPRLETPSPLPTFKVRKEKLGDRITALQQLVAPFGKTDTASVLHEAIEYIKLLHDQVASLSSPYLKNASPMQLQHKGSDNAKDGGRNPRQDLRSRGLCLVPIASTYTVASEAGPEFWHPTFGGTFR